MGRREEMENRSDTWELIQGKMLELRILTNANWKNSEWELAALGERVLRTVEMSRAESEKMQADYENLQQSIEELRQEWQFKNIFEVDQIPDRHNQTSSAG
jgi:hypothetical protein